MEESWKWLIKPEHVVDSIQCPECNVLFCMDHEVCLSAMKSHLKTHAQKENVISPDYIFLVRSCPFHAPRKIHG